jgi:hypothetical protein
VALLLMLGALVSLGATIANAAPDPPHASKPVRLSGEARLGQTLRARPRGWSGGTSVTFAYQWLRCDRFGAHCATIENAVANTYTVVAADEGKTLRVWLTGSNSTGAEQVVSPKTGMVPTVAPITAPTSKSQCKHDGWRQFTNPTFRDQQACVDYVKNLG